MNQPDGENDFKELAGTFGSKNGLYMFTLRATDVPLYIGSADKQDLLGRVGQHLNRSTGGDFRKAVMKNPELKLIERARKASGSPAAKAKAATEELDTRLKDEALRYIRDHTQVYLAITAATEASPWEHLAMLLYKPKYNRAGTGNK